MVPECGSPLLGRSWFGKLGLPLAKFIMDRADTGINNVGKSEDADIINIVNDFDALFGPGIGLYTKGVYKLILNDDAILVFCKPRPLPYMQ